MYCVVVSQCRSFNNYHRFVHYCDFGIPFIYYPYVGNMPIIIAWRRLAYIGIQPYRYIW